MICVGVDMVEYPPRHWNPDRDKKIVHIDEDPAEVDAHYIPESGVIGDSLSRIAAKAQRRGDAPLHKTHDVIQSEIGEYRDDTAFPVKP